VWCISRATYSSTATSPSRCYPVISLVIRWRASGSCARPARRPVSRTRTSSLFTALARRPVLASVGHSLATADDIHAFAAAGGRLSTHLGNGLPAQIDRHHNPIWAQLTEDALTAGLIADGHHLPADTFAALVRAKGPQRCVLTSDAAALAGCAPGDYRTAVGGAVTVGPDGSLRLQGTPYLAGSGASLLDCLRWATGPGGLPLDIAVTMATRTPADLLGLHDRGRLEVGARADLVQLTSTSSGAVGDVAAVVVNGRVVACSNS